MTRLKKEDIALVIKEILDHMKEEKKNVISGSQAAGLYPFNPNAVDYDILNKRKKSKKSVRDTDLQEDRNLHLKTFENNLDPNLLSEFENALPSGIWTTDEENKGLFKYWLNLKNGMRNIFI